MEAPFYFRAEEIWVRVGTRCFQRTSLVRGLASLARSHLIRRIPPGDNLKFFLTLAGIAHTGSRLAARRWAPQHGVAGVSGIDGLDGDGLNPALN